MNFKSSFDLPKRIFVTGFVSNKHVQSRNRAYDCMYGGNYSVMKQDFIINYFNIHMYICSAKRINFQAQICMIMQGSKSNAGEFRVKL